MSVNYSGNKLYYLVKYPLKCPHSCILSYTFTLAHYTHAYCLFMIKKLLLLKLLYMQLALWKLIILFWGCIVKSRFHPVMETQQIVDWESMWQQLNEHIHNSYSSIKNAFLQFDKVITKKNVFIYIFLKVFYQMGLFFFFIEYPLYVSHIFTSIKSPLNQLQLFFHTVKLSYSHMRVATIFFLNHIASKLVEETLLTIFKCML